MQDFQQRVVEEERELGERLTKLKAFLATPTYLALDYGERTRLTHQARAMQDYLDILRERIAAFADA